MVVLSDRDAVQFGDAAVAAGFTIPQALDAIFDQGAGTVIVINVCDPAIHRSTVSEEAVMLSTITHGAKLAHPYVSAVVVKSANGLTTHVLNTDYTVDAENGEVVRVLAGAIPAGASLKVSYEYVDPTLVTPSQVIGTVTAGGQRTGLQALDDTYNRFGFDAKLVLAPVYCTLLSVSTEMIAMAHKLRAIGFAGVFAGAFSADADSAFRQPARTPWRSRYTPSARGYRNLRASASSR